MKKLLVVAFIAVFACAAYAQEFDTKHRVSVFGGVYLTNGEVEDGVGEKLDFDNGFTTGIDYKYRMHQYFSVGGFLDYYYAETETFNGPVNSVDIEASSVVIGVSGTAHYDINNFGLYGTLGLGLGFNKIDADISVGNLTVSDDESETSFVFIVGAGATYRITKLMDVGLGVKYTYNSFSTDLFDADIDMSGISINGAVGFNF